MLLGSEHYRKALEALAVGDAMGMPTEFMSRERIVRELGLISTILDPSLSPIHRNLRAAQVTDDTEQNLYLIRAYHDQGVTVDVTAAALLRWIAETDAEAKGYVGPSSLRALKAIQGGADPLEAGKGGTTCGAAMRAPAAALCAPGNSEAALRQALIDCTVPTHNTSLAKEAALAIGCAVRAAADGLGADAIIAAGMEGGRAGREHGGDDGIVGASTCQRTEHLMDRMRGMRRDEDVLDLIYYLTGAGMEANEVTPAALALFWWARDDVWRAIRMGASLGGDTDTVAALAGILCALHARGHDIPAMVLDEVLAANDLRLAEHAELIAELRAH